jgi:hypothetical protein
MPATAGTIGKPTAVITSATEETVATAEEADYFGTPATAASQTTLPIRRLPNCLLYLKN